ncbi:MAG TPA: hypothetical protein VKB57_28110 [Acidimicrobiales bacterium]|nr:hypothetical protein [Acidimicrobiales bacterium]
MRAADSRERGLGGTLRWVVGWVAAHANVIVAVAVGFAVVVSAGLAIHQGASLRYHDERQYMDIVDNLVHRHQYSLDGVGPTAYKPPAWPFLLAAGRWLGLGIVGLKFINVALLGACVYGGSRLARRVAGPAAGALAAIVIAVCPVAIYTASTLYPQIMGGALLLWGLVAATGIPDSPRPGRQAALTGLLFSLLLLTVPTLATAFVAVLIWLLVTAGRAGWRILALAVAAAAVLPIGWAIRNTVQMNAFIPVATDDGVNLLLGNSENAGPDTGVNADISRYIDSAERRGLDEVETSDYYRNAAIDWIKANPGDAASLYVRKVVHHFGFRDQLATDESASPARDLAVALTYYPLLALVIVRFALSRRRRPSSIEIMLVGWYLAFGLVTAAFFPRIRFRLPADLVLFAEAAVAAVVLVGMTSRAPEPAPEPAVD